MSSKLNINLILNKHNYTVLNSQPSSRKHYPSTTKAERLKVPKIFQARRLTEAQASKPQKNGLKMASYPEDFNRAINQESYQNEVKLLADSNLADISSIAQSETTINGKNFNRRTSDNEKIVNFGFVNLSFETGPLLTLLKIDEKDLSPRRKYRRKIKVEIGNVEKEKKFQKNRKVKKLVLKQKEQKPGLLKNLEKLIEMGVKEGSQAIKQRTARDTRKVRISKKRSGSNSGSVGLKFKLENILSKSRSRGKMSNDLKQTSVPKIPLDTKKRRKQEKVRQKSRKKVQKLVISSRSRQNSTGWLTERGRTSKRKKSIGANKRILKCHTTRELSQGPERLAKPKTSRNRSRKDKKSQREMSQIQRKNSQKRNFYGLRHVMTRSSFRKGIDTDRTLGKFATCGTLDYQLDEIQKKSVYDRDFKEKDKNSKQQYYDDLKDLIHKKFFPKKSMGNQK
jgi:hypothetical protein